MSDDEEFNKKFEEMCLEYKRRNKKSPKRNTEESDDEGNVEETPTTAAEPPKIREKQKKERINSDVTYSTISNGQERVYKYRTTMLRAKFMDVQRDEYKKECKEHGMDFINEMFKIIAMWYWQKVVKSYIGVDEEEITKPVKLIEYYVELPDEMKDKIFAKKPYYKLYFK